MLSCECKNRVVLYFFLELDYLQLRLKALLFIFTVEVLPCTSEQEGDVRLVGGHSGYEGRVEVCNGGEYGTVCTPESGKEEAAVVCRQLGFSVAGVC